MARKRRMKKCRPSKRAEWMRKSEAMKMLRRHRLRVSPRTVTRWAQNGAVLTKHLPGAKSWYVFNAASLLAAAREYSEIR